MTAYVCHCAFEDTLVNLLLHVKNEFNTVVWTESIDVESAGEMSDAYPVSTTQTGSAKNRDLIIHEKPY